MEKKKRNVVIAVVVSIVAVVAIGVVAKLVLDSQNRQEENETVQGTNEEEDYGYVEPETVTLAVAKFNTEIMDQTGWELTPVNDETMVTHENMYWYPLYDDLALVVVPVEFTGDKDKDTALTTLIYADKDSANREKALEYLRLLVQANDENLTEDEISGLVEEAENLRERGEMANRGNGIFVTISESDDHSEYQVVRNYRETE